MTDPAAVANNTRLRVRICPFLLETMGSKVWMGGGTGQPSMVMVGREEDGSWLCAYHWYPSLQSIDVFVFCSFICLQDPFIFKLGEGDSWVAVELGGRLREA
jgi:hypothetical protein